MSRKQGNRARRIAEKRRSKQHQGNRLRKKTLALSVILRVFAEGKREAALRMAQRNDLLGSPFLVGAFRARIGSLTGQYLFTNSVYGKFWIVDHDDPIPGSIPVLPARTLYEFSLYCRAFSDY